jgi:hypothetical protein
MNERATQLVKAFLAGFVSTLVFHQGLLTLLYLAGAVPRAPYDLATVPPLGIPAVISLAFWGGVWGAAIWPLLTNVSGASYWVRALVLGAVGPRAVALFIVFPLKGLPMAGGWAPQVIAGALMLNGAWGLGLALLMRLMRRSRHAPGRGRGRNGGRRPELRHVQSARFNTTQHHASYPLNGEAERAPQGSS